MFPLLTGFSIFCLAAPNNATVSRVFGGSNGNEGLGLLSLCFDWQVVLAISIWVTLALNSICLVHLGWFEPDVYPTESSG